MLLFYEIASEHTSECVEKVTKRKFNEAAKFDMKNAEKMHLLQCACDVDGLHKNSLRLKGIVHLCTTMHFQLAADCKWWVLSAVRSAAQERLFTHIFFCFSCARLEIGSSSLSSSSWWSRSERRIDTFDQRQTISTSMPLLPFLALRCTRAS